MNMRHELLTSGRGPDERGAGRARSRFLPPRLRSLRLDVLRLSSRSLRRRCRRAGWSRERLTDARDRDLERLRLWRSVRVATELGVVEVGVASAGAAEPEAAFAFGAGPSVALPDQDGTLDPLLAPPPPPPWALNAPSSRATRSFFSPLAGKPRFLSASRSSETFILADILSGKRVWPRGREKETKEPTSILMGNPGIVV